MLATLQTGLVSLLATAEGAEEEGGDFLVKPDVGLMIWTLLAFLVTFFLLKKLAFPKIGESLDRRQRAIEESIDTAEQTKVEADALLAEYRERLKEARTQADEIVAKARKSGEALEAESAAAARKRNEELLEQSKKDIEAQTARAVQEIRDTVADLTILATEKVTRKSLTDADQKRLVDEALAELDFTKLEGSRN